MNTLTVTMEHNPNPFSGYLYSLKMSAACIFSALKFKSTVAPVGYTALLDNKRPDGNFPKVSGLHGVSYGENERDRLFFG